MDKIALIGLSHHTAPVEIREKIAFSANDVPEALDRISSIAGVKEVMLFSTCNRVEVLVVAENEYETVPEVKKFIAEYNHVPLSEFENNLYVLEGEDAVRHIFRVASSLDSLVVGEPQILGQIKDAFQFSLKNKTNGVILNRLLPRAFSVAKKIRSETGIGDRAVSISYAAIELSRKIFDTLEGKKALLIGAGEMAELAVEHLIQNRIARIYVANRTFERGFALAKRFDGEAIRFEEISGLLNEVDVIISSTGSPDFVITRDQVKDVMKARRNRPIFFIDIAVPRDIDPQINQVSNVYVYDIDDLKSAIDKNIQDRKKEAVKGERIVDEAVINFHEWREGLEITPTLIALRKKMDIIAGAEMERTLKSLNHLAPDDRKALNRMIKSMINKMLHDPTLFLKSEGFGENKSLFLDVISKLFNLDNQD
jgi:glutamyl-tRNA reductase